MEKLAQRTAKLRLPKPNHSEIESKGIVAVYNGLPADKLFVFSRPFGKCSEFRKAVRTLTMYTRLREDVVVYQNMLQITQQSDITFNVMWTVENDREYLFTIVWKLDSDTGLPFLSIHKSPPKAPQQLIKLLQEALGQLFADGEYHDAAMKVINRKEYDSAMIDQTLVGDEFNYLDN